MIGDVCMFAGQSRGLQYLERGGGGKVPEKENEGLTCSNPTLITDPDRSITVTLVAVMI